jgi:hypothetical protein
MPSEADKALPPELWGDAHWGPVGTPRPHFSTVNVGPDPDDEELETTPPDVVAILGFDPKDLEDN